MVLDNKQDDDSDTNMNSAVSTESMDMTEEVSLTILSRS